MRTFIAFELDNRLKTRIAKIQDKLRKMSVKGRWTHIDNFHLTLKFLGETSIEQSKKIEEQLSYTLKFIDEVKLSLDSIGFFPGNVDMRVLWLGLKGDIYALQKLYNHIENGMAELGYNRENRKFSPHITLGRNILFNDNFDTVREKVKEDCEYSFTLSQISLVESQLIKGKRIYTPLKCFNLKKPL